MKNYPIAEISREDYISLLASEELKRPFGFKYTPVGRFYLRDGEKYVGVDNSTGHAWVEEFDRLDDCKRWLLGDSLEELRKEEI